MCRLWTTDVTGTQPSLYGRWQRRLVSNRSPTRPVFQFVFPLNVGISSSSASSFFVVLVKVFHALVVVDGLPFLTVARADVDQWLVADAPPATSTSTPRRRLRQQRRRLVVVVVVVVVAVVVVGRVAGVDDVAVPVALPLLVLVLSALLLLALVPPAHRLSVVCRFGVFQLHYKPKKNSNDINAIISCSKKKRSHHSRVELFVRLHWWCNITTRVYAHLVSSGDLDEDFQLQIGDIGLPIIQRPRRFAKCFIS